MTPGTTIAQSFERSFALYRDLAASMDAGTLASKLGELPSNTMGAQLWCVVGARESYARAIEAGKWAGFSCSLSNPGEPYAVMEALVDSEQAVAAALGGYSGFSEAQHRLLLDLLEHEAQHHGQLIRYLYGLRLPVPQSWKDRYALD